MEHLFKWFVEDKTGVYVDWFVSSFTVDVFNAEDKLLYKFLEYCSNLGIPAEEKCLDVFLRTESKPIIKELDIRLSEMSNFNYNEPAALEEATRVINNVVMSKFSSMLEEDLTSRNFKVDVMSFMSEAFKDGITNLMTDSFAAMNTGTAINELADEMIWRLNSMKENFSVGKIAKLDFMSGDDYDRTKKDQMTHIFNTGLPCVDGDVGGVFTKQLMAIAGSPGTGKTRLAAIHFAYQCMIEAKKDVLFYELELSEGEVRNMLIAYHIVRMFGGAVKIPDKIMNQGLLTAEQEKYVEAARIDLFESGKYGKIKILTSKLIVETMETEIYQVLRHNPNIKYLIIDYAGLAGSNPIGKYDRKLVGYEIIQELYKNTKDIIKTADIGALIVNQFNNEGVSAAESGKTIIPGMVQGGMIVERHADYEFVMTATKEQELAKQMMMSTVKVRSATGFQNVPYNHDLSVSIFRQMKQDAVS